MLLSTCWVPLLYIFKRYVNHKSVISIVGYMDRQGSGSNISLNSLDVINDLKHDYERMQVTFNMNNKTFVYCALSNEFSWPIKDKYIHTWIRQAFLVSTFNEITTMIDVTDVIDMYAGPQRNFFDTAFDFNWIPEFANTTDNVLNIYDQNDFCYKINLSTNTEINDTGLLESICGIKLLRRSSSDFETT